MEFRVLQYFLAVTREESISAAAKVLHLSQPTLSRQLMDMEEELGKKLFVRSNRKITLTEEGVLLRNRAEEILKLVEKTEKEISLSDKVVVGDVYIGAGETEGVRQLVKIMVNLREKYPMVNFHIVSGDRTTVMEELEHGLMDFALIFGEVDNRKYNSIELDSVDCFGVMMRKDDKLAKMDVIDPRELINEPLIVSRQILKENNLSEIFGCDESDINIVGSYSLLFNGSLMVEEGMGYAICFDNIINTTGKSSLCFRPLSTEIRPKMSLVWKKYHVFTKPAEKFLMEIHEVKNKILKDE